MDLFDLNKIQEDGKEMREILTRERTNIIKLLTEQDAKCLDLQSKMQILEETNKNLKETIVTTQKKYEELVQKHADEMKNRSEVVSKVNSTKELIDFLKNIVIELNETLSRCKSDNKTLSLSLEECTKEGKAIREQIEKQKQKNKDAISIQEKTLQYQAEKEKKIEGLNYEKNVLEGELKVYKLMLLKSEKTIMEINKQYSEYKMQLTQELSEPFENTKKELEDSKKLIDELYADIQIKTDTLNDLSKSNEELKRQVKDKDAFTNSILDQNKQLAITLTQEAIQTTENLKKTVIQLEGEKENLKKSVTDKELIISQKDGEISHLEKECEITPQLVDKIKALQEEVDLKNKLLADRNLLVNIGRIIEETVNKKRERENESQIDSERAQTSKAHTQNAKTNLDTTEQIYNYNESDDQDDYLEGPPLKCRRHPGPKSSIKNLEKEPKTIKKRSKKVSVQTDMF